MTPDTNVTQLLAACISIWDEAPDVASAGRDGEISAIDESLEALAKLDPRKAQVIEMQFFGGLSVEETGIFAGRRPGRLIGLVFLSLWILVQSRPARAQAPFYTDDTGVADSGVLHVEASDEIDALQSMQYPDLRQNTTTLKTNVGLPHGLELDLDLPYLVIDRSAITSSSQGIGDTNLGLKWRIREGSATSHSPALAVSFYTEFPTGNARQNLGSGLIDYWLNLIAQVPVSERIRITTNLGILFAGNTSTGVVGIETTHGHVYTGGLSVLCDVNSRLTLGAEVYGGIADTVGLDRTQLQTMFGVQYTMREGLSLYAGAIAGTYTASPKLGGVLGFAIDFPHLFDATARGAAQRSARAPGDARAHLFPSSTGDSHDL